MASLVVGLMLRSSAIAIVALLYAPLMMARTNGKTLGRMAVGIRVVRANGEPMTFGWAMLREVAVKALLFGFAQLDHVRPGEPRRRAVAAVGRREPRAARLHRRHARRRDELRRARRAGRGAVCAAARRSR